MTLAGDGVQLDRGVADRPSIGVVAMDLHAVASLMTRRIVDQLDGTTEDTEAADEVPEASRFLARGSVG